MTIVDPHIKKDTSYWVHKDCTDKGFYTKNKEGGDYEGWCWPGASYYPDFLNGDVRQYFAEQYRLENYQGTNLVSSAKKASNFLAFAVRLIDFIKPTCRMCSPGTT